MDIMVLVPIKNGGNMMKETLEVLKKFINKRSELSLSDLGKYDPDYNANMKNVIKSSEAYESLDLDEKSREIVDKLLSDRDGVEMDQANLAYLAGFRDCILVISYLKLIDF